MKADARGLREPPRWWGWHAAVSPDEGRHLYKNKNEPGGDLILLRLWKLFGSIWTQSSQAGIHIAPTIAKKKKDLNVNVSVRGCFFYTYPVVQQYWWLHSTRFKRLPLFAGDVTMELFLQLQCLKGCFIHLCFFFSSLFLFNNTYKSDSNGRTIRSIISDSTASRSTGGPAQPSHY